jgi:hypothetical protein
VHAAPAPTAITHRFVETNGTRRHVAEAGQGPQTPEAIFYRLYFQPPGAALLEFLA